MPIALDANSTCSILIPSTPSTPELSFAYVISRPIPSTMSTQEILSSNGSNDIMDNMDHLKMEDRLGPDGEPAPKTDEEYAQAQLTLRAIVSSKEAGVIIGKGGKNVADLRDETGVKAGVSKVVQGVHDRVLTITGGCDAISRAYAIVARALLEGAPAMGMGGIVQGNGTHPIKLLISHNQMGTVIGRQGLKIKHIQDVSGVRMVAQKEMLPQSTERIVEVQGTPEGIQRALWEICKCLVDDWQRGTGTVLYNPVVRTQPGTTSNVGSTGSFSASGNGRSEYSSPRVMRTGNGSDFSNGGGARPFSRRSDSDAASRGPPTHDENGEEIQTQNISIPADMVGCIIGRAGSKISEIRKTSGARISIAKAPHDETGERMFTIMGTAKANESALFLLYENLEAEKMRRSQLQDTD
ncbi:KH domain RNA-binding protein [Cordyceps fumosorosea ARSEF 2679]|uniref:KH domain RNA-binding protein n=1 Tax=Cordyceps fumosorosea (strain ARSEF 2679) TaxID=1081104 RepID=A0A162K676_CORFA|nr:KH domain RNA-binding protein [Cordyceps fumosorosea ARSEF 2679]OAA53878.1 KH domain RNA-binding protein [Cordyceps fumosorosea ARSEF 2679]